MWHNKGKTGKKGWNRERKHTAVQKCTAYLAAGILFGGAGAVLPLQAEGMPPHITSHPQDVCVEAGDCAYFSVSATGENLTYQWLVNKGEGGDYREINGANESIYRVMVFDGSMNGYAYKCRVKSNEEGSNKENAIENDEKEKNYEDSRAAILTIVYKIVGGARSVWVKSSGRGLVFQGSGAYSRFSGINVDGSRITAGEYNKGGSQTPFTEVTLLRSYLETLAEGEHELEIVWEDGTAKTAFWIEPPAANLPADAAGLGRTGADTEGSSRAAGKTSAAKDAAAAAGAENHANEDETQSKDSGRDGEKAAQVSENTAAATVSGNTAQPSQGTAADVLSSAGILADGQRAETTVTRGERRTERMPSGFEKNPARLAAMSTEPDRYAGTICMAVIAISAAGIAVGLIGYRLHDREVKGKNEG